MKLEHYHLVAGKVLFRDPENNGLGNIELNAVLKTDDGLITANHMGQAQKTLQMTMFKKLEDPKLEVVDVFIIAISNLGQMTAEQFHKEPEQVQDPTKLI